MADQAEQHAESVVPFDARVAMQRALWKRCLSQEDNEWTTWSDAVTLAEVAAQALTAAGFEVRLIDGSPDA